MQLHSDVNFGVHLGPTDVTEMEEFPPNRFRPRDERLRLLRRLWLGDFSDFQMFDKATVEVNYFASYVSQIGNMLLMEEPEGDVSVETMFDAIAHMLVYGGCILYQVGGETGTVDPMLWYPLADGSFYWVIPFVSDVADDARPDRAEVWYFSGESAERAVYQWEPASGTTGRFGNLLEPWTGLGPAQHTVVPLLPARNGWGSSMLLKIADPVIEYANRAGRNSRVLDLNGRPILAVTQSQASAEEVYSLDDPVDTPAGRDELEKALTEENAREVLYFGDDTQAIKFESPNVEGVRVSLEQMEEMLSAVRFITGLPDLSGEYQPPSGEALKRELLPLYSQTLSMLNALVQGWEEIGVPIRWEHVFDVLERSGNAEPAGPSVMDASLLEGVGT